MVLNYPIWCDKNSNKACTIWENKLPNNVVDTHPYYVFLTTYDNFGLGPGYWLFANNRTRALSFRVIDELELRRDMGIIQSDYNSIYTLKKKKKS